MRTLESNRAGLNTGSVEKSIESLLLSLNKEIAAIEQQFTFLLSIPGIRPVSAEAHLSETGVFSRFERVSEVVAFVGLSPPQERSFWSSVRGPTSISRKGNPRLRCLQYLPALTAQWANPLVSRFSQGFTELGKAAKVILYACMRKLVHLAFGVLKPNKVFDPSLTSISLGQATRYLGADAPQNDRDFVSLRAFQQIGEMQTVKKQGGNALAENLGVGRLFCSCF